MASSESLLVSHQRSRQQYRCVYCPDFLHSSVVHLRHHCLTRHPGKPISYKHTVLPCSEIKSGTSPGNSDRAPAVAAAASAKSSVTQTTAAPAKEARAPVDVTSSAAVTKPSAKPEDSARPAEIPDDSYNLDFEDLDSEESDNSEDDDWDEYVPKKKKKKTKTKTAPVTKKTVSKPAAATNYDAGPTTAGAAGTAGTSGTIVCDICNSYSTPYSTVMRHHIMSHLHYFPYYCPHCTSFRSVRSFPIIKHIRMKHQGQAERFECDPDPELEKKVRTSCHRVKSDQKVPRAAPVMEERDAPQPPQPEKYRVETEVMDSPRKPEEQEPTMTTALSAAVNNKSRKILYKCKICGLRTHLRGDFRHHVMRELHYKPYK